MLPGDAACLDCRYALSGLAEPRCPECGRTFDPHDPQTYLWSGYRRRRSFFRIPVLPARQAIAYSISGILAIDWLTGGLNAIVGGIALFVFGFIWLWTGSTRAAQPAAEALRLTSAQRTVRKWIPLAVLLIFVSLPLSCAPIVMFRLQLEPFLLAQRAEWLMQLMPTASGVDAVIFRILPFGTGAQARVFAPAGEVQIWIPVGPGAGQSYIYRRGSGLIDLGWHRWPS